MNTNERPHWSECPPILLASEFESRMLKEDLTGNVIGSFRVVGFALEMKSSWIVQCSCGLFESRKAKSIKNPNNRDDKCLECRKNPILLLPPVEREVTRTLDRGSCGKVKFTSESATKKAIHRRMKKGANCDRLRAYFCKDCRAWHMSSNFFGKGSY